MATKNENDAISSTEQSVTTDVVTDLTLPLDTFFQSPSGDAARPSSLGAMPFVRDDSALAHFLSRPVRIHDLVWNTYVSTYIVHEYDVWTMFLTSSAVAQKLSYYSRLRGDLVVRAIINGTPMHYGVLRMAYRMHPSMASTEDYVYNQATTADSTIGVTGSKMVLSQMPGKWINPCYDSTVDMVIPYMSPVSGFDLAKKNFSEMGRLVLAKYTPLYHANGGTDPIHIELYAHMENIVLDVPTAVPQGYTLDEASRVVSRVIRAAAKGTSIAREWVPRVASAAAMLGFSRPLETDPPAAVRNLPFALANYDAPDTCEKFSLSNSAEFTLGGQELGVSGEDELVLSRFAARSSWVGTATWNQTHTVGTFVGGAVVTPYVAVQGTYTKPVSVQGPTGYNTVGHVVPTPCAFASMFARYWKGIMCYKFTVTCSPYHKGRLRVYYEPNPSNYTYAPQVNLNNSAILDLAESRTITVEVPWQSTRDMAEIVSLSGYVNATTTEANFTAAMAGLSGKMDNHNGVLVCEVLSPLTGIVDSAAVFVHMEVWAKDLVLFSPVLPRAKVNGINLASGVPLAVDMQAVGYVPQSFDITGGDAIVSLRQLIKRYSLEYSTTLFPWILGGSGTYESVFGSYYLPLTLPPPSILLTDVGALDMAIPGHAVGGASLTTGDYVAYTIGSYQTYISMAFAMSRGSMRWKASAQMFQGGGYRASAPLLLTMANISVPTFGNSREWTPGLDIGTYSSSVVTPAYTQSLRAHAAQYTRGISRGGQVAGAPNGNSVMACIADVEFPHVSGTRANLVRAAPGNDPEGKDKQNAAILMECATPVSSAISYCTVEIYTSVGEDYNVFAFMHAPSFLFNIPQAN